MRLKDLSRFQIPELVINAWISRQGDYLLPLQEKAVRAGLLENSGETKPPNLLISAPTSAGKSFCGEMAAVVALLHRKKAVMLLPLKSIAEEKYNYYRRCYGPIGIRTIIVTGDHPENDADFELGNFDLALAIYEKFNRLLTVNLDILRQIGLVVVDEFQMIGDAERGAELEMALIKTLNSGYNPGIVALSAVLNDETEAAEWLQCKIIKEATRPVDLLQGIASEGYFHFRSFNSGVEGREKFELKDNHDDLTEGLIDFLKEDESRKLIFLKSRRDTINAAFRLASSVNWGEAGSTLRLLEGEESSFLIRALRQTLSRGVAFHNADLTPSQRQAVEQGYLKGEIRVIFSTTTLAMGVNLPAEMVLLETMKYTAGGFGGKPGLVPITEAEFQNITGRAGRFGFGGDRPGKAVVLAASRFEHEVLWSNYIDIPHHAKLISSLGSLAAADLVLDLAVSGFTAAPEEIDRILFSSLYYREDKIINRDIFIEALEQLSSLRLMGSDHLPTALGIAAAESGLTVAGCRHYMKLLEVRYPETRFGWLFLALSAPQFDISHCGLTAKEYRSHLYEKLLRREFESFISEISPHIAPKLEQEPLDFCTSAVLKGVLLLNDWAEEMPVEQLEQRYQLHHGQIINLAEAAAWLLTSLGRLLAAADCHSVWPRRLEDFGFSVQFGIPPEMREIHRLTRDVLTRNDYRLLRKEGVRSADELIGIPYERLGEIIKPPEKLNRLLENINSLNKEEKMNKTTICDSTSYHPGASLGMHPGFHPSIIELDGNYEGERYLIRIDGFPVRLTGKSFKYLVKLAYARLVNNDGWIYKDDIEIGFNQARYLYRLRQEVSHNGVCPWQIFENNRLGYYRLDLEPSRIKLNLNNLKSNPDYELQRIAAELSPRLVS